MLKKIGVTICTIILFFVLSILYVQFSGSNLFSTVNADSPETIEQSVKNDLEAVVIPQAETTLLKNDEAQSVQQIAIVWKSNISDLLNVRLVYQNENGEEMEIPEADRTDKALLFEEDTAALAEGHYSLIGLRYQIAGFNEEKSFYFSDSQIDAEFTVSKINKNEETAEENIAEIEISDQKNMESKVADDIEQTLDKMNAPKLTALSANAPFIIVLNPGHGGSDPGACAYGLQEKDLNLKIARYCKEELEQYNGVKVYMTRDTDCNESLEHINDYAASVNADLLVSIHNNAGGGTGTEIYYPNQNYRSDLYHEGAGVSQSVLNELVALGLNNRGTKIRTITDDASYNYPDGSYGDYYSVIRNAKRNGYCGIIIEHAFIDNASDVNNFLNSDAKLKKLGIADATGIADYYGLSKASLCEISGKSIVTKKQLMGYFSDLAGKTYPSFYATSDAPTLADFCQIYMEEAKAENIRVEVAFCQAMKETGWLNYGGQVKREQYNFAGIGAIDGGGSGASFSTVREGIRAQIQHLKAYANSDPLNNPCVDPRFHLVTRGCAPYVEWLGQKENPEGKGWATGQNYGYDIVAMIEKLKTVKSDTEQKIGVWGKSRIQTALASADKLLEVKNVSKHENIIVAYAHNFPDALSGGYLSQVKDAPVLLIDEKSKEEVLNYIKAKSNADATVYILGGFNVISQDVETEIAGIRETKRLANDDPSQGDRYDTNLAILKECGSEFNELLLCSGAGFADALSASSVHAPIFLIEGELSEKQEDYLKGCNVGTVYAVGGYTVIPDAAAKAVAADLRIEFDVKEGRLTEDPAYGDRFDTSLAVAKKFYPKATNIVLANAYGFADGLAGGPLAHALKAPVILVDRNNVIYYAIDYKDQTKNVYIMGGPISINRDAVNRCFDGGKWNDKEYGK